MKLLDYTKIAEEYNRQIKGFEVDIDPEINRVLTGFATKMIQSLVNSINESIKDHNISSGVCNECYGIVKHYRNISIEPFEVTSIDLCTQCGAKVPNVMNNIDKETE